MTTPTLSEAPAEMVTVPETEAWFAGLVIATVGGVVSLIATVTAAEGAVFPLMPYASAEIVWLLPWINPLVFQFTPYGLEVAVPMSVAPSR
jgi:hypothetical protein